jgi:hypothetical protein
MFPSTFPNHQLFKLTLGKKLGLPVATRQISVRSALIRAAILGLVDQAEGTSSSSIVSLHQ